MGPDEHRSLEGPAYLASVPYAETAQSDLPETGCKGLEGHGGRHARPAGPLQAAVTEHGSGGTTQ